MSDFVSYDCHKRKERPAPREDGKVALSPERWQSLRAYLDSLRLEPDEFSDTTEIKLDVMIDVDGITFLPAVYCAA